MRFKISIVVDTESDVTQEKFIFEMDKFLSHQKYFICDDEDFQLAEIIMIDH